MNIIKELTLEETSLKEEMKNNCLTKGKYIDDKAKDKFKMLCHLEDFEIQYHTINKGIDKILKKYEDEKRKTIEDMTILSKYTGSINELLQKQVVLTIIEKIIQDLKKLKGE